MHTEPFQMRKAHALHNELGAGKRGGKEQEVNYAKCGKQVNLINGEKIQNMKLNLIKWESHKNIEAISSFI